MKNVQIVITNPAVNPVMTGTPRHKPARHNVQVLINMLVPVQTKLEEVVQLVAANTQLALVPADMNGAAVLVKNVQVLINILVPEQMKPGVVVHLAEENIRRVNVQVVMTGATVLVLNAQVLINMLVPEQMKPVVVVRLAVENIQLVHAMITYIFGAEMLVLKKMLV